MFGDHDDDDRNERILQRVFEGQMFAAEWLLGRIVHEIRQSEERIMTQVDQEGQDIIAAINDAGTELENLEAQLSAAVAAQAANAQAAVDLTGIQTAATALRAKLTAIGSAAGGSTGGTTGGTTPSTETALAGDAKAAAEAAALAAVPGATVVRSEIDSVTGLPEVHVTNPDGSASTVQLDANNVVTKVLAGDEDAGAAPTA